MNLNLLLSQSIRECSTVAYLVHFGALWKAQSILLNWSIKNFHEAYLEPNQTSEVKLFAKVATYKAPPYMFEWILNAPLHSNNANSLVNTLSSQCHVLIHTASGIFLFLDFNPIGVAFFYRDSLSTFSKFVVFIIYSFFSPTNLRSNSMI